MTLPWKWSVWRNPDRERTNQNARIYLKTILPYNQYAYFTQFSNLNISGTNADICKR